VKLSRLSCPLYGPAFSISKNPFLIDEKFEIAMCNDANVSREEFNDRSFTVAKEKWGQEFETTRKLYIYIFLIRIFNFK
jgi:hypothetical protein